MDLFVTLAVLLGLTALFSFVNERLLRLETTIGLMVLALAMSLTVWVLDLAGVIDLLDEQRALVSKLKLDETLLNGVLCFMLFAGSVNVKIRLLAEEKWLIGSLAIGGTLIAWILTGLLLWGVTRLFGLEISPIYAFLFGALISPTDPIAALAILGKVGLPERLEAIIGGESLFNDGVGVVLFTMCLAIAVSPEQPTFADAVVLFLREVLGGVALGLGAAGLMRWMLVRSRDYGTHLLITLGIVALSYALAEAVEVSGPIAAVVTGLVIGNVSEPAEAGGVHRLVRDFWHGIDETLNALLFVLIGLTVVLVYPVESFPAGLSAILVCLIARLVSVYLPVSMLARTPALQADAWGLSKLLTWGGLRGGLALALALSIPAVPQKGAIVYMTFAVVAFSVIVQGLTISKIFKPEALKRLIT
ncbi:MAG: sodium:proton antiporter [Kiloniellales bacterium]|nr:sodium:proton antiporter [Kiloniellales bacterium]